MQNLYCLKHKDFRFQGLRLKCWKFRGDGSLKEFKIIDKYRAEQIIYDEVLAHWRIGSRSIFISNLL